MLVHRINRLELPYYKTKIFVWQNQTTCPGHPAYNLFQSNYTQYPPQLQTPDQPYSASPKPLTTALTPSRCTGIPASPNPNLLRARYINFWYSLTSTS